MESKNCVSSYLRQARICSSAIIWSWTIGISLNDEIDPILNAAEIVASKDVGFQESVFGR